jgi:glycosyl transferase-like sugar-binding protein
VNPVPIVQYWHEPQPPDYIAELLASFRERNPDMRHLVFDESAAAVFVSEHFGPRQAAAFGVCAVPAMQADYFRYCAVHVLGGVYVDADFRCEEPLRELAERPSGVVFMGSEIGVINGFFAFPPRHPLPRLAVQVATANVENRFSQSVWGTTGPAIFSCLYGLSRLGSFDAFLAATRVTPPGLGRDGQPMWDAELFCEAVGDCDLATAAFDGVETLPREAMSRWLSKRDVRTPYKRTEDHYPHYSSSIYRSSR